MSRVVELDSLGIRAVLFVIVVVFERQVESVVFKGKVQRLRHETVRQDGCFQVGVVILDRLLVSGLVLGLGVVLKVMRKVMRKVGLVSVLKVGLVIVLKVGLVVVLKIGLRTGLEIGLMKT